MKTTQFRHRPTLTLVKSALATFLPDSDIRVRRAWLAAYVDTAVLQGVDSNSLARETANELTSDPPEEAIHSLGTELAMRYLAQYEGIESADNQILTLGDTRFEPLSASFGGYQNLDDGGYQIFMRYRSLKDLTARISFSQVLDNNFDPTLVKNKIVLIGSVNRSSKDLFSTPFNRGDITQTPGVVLHAQVASQILSAVLDGETLPWAWPDWAEIGWIVVLTGVGSGLMVLTQRGLVLITFGVGGLGTAAAVSLAGFTLGGWVPVVAPVSAFFLSAAGARISKSYQRRYWEAKQM